MKYLVIIIFVIMVIFYSLIDRFIFQYFDIFIITYLPYNIYINISIFFYI